jgi:hypothetical protein
MGEVYPFAAGHVSGSETSRRSADNLVVAKVADQCEAVLKAYTQRGELLTCKDVEHILRGQGYEGLHETVSGRIRGSLFLDRQCVYLVGMDLTTGKRVCVWLETLYRKTYHLKSNNRGEIIYEKKLNKSTKQLAWVYGWAPSSNPLTDEEQREYLQAEALEDAWRKAGKLVRQRFLAERCPCDR